LFTMYSGTRRFSIWNVTPNKAYQQS
jgi:hypothetical protein